MNRFVLCCLPLFALHSGLCRAEPMPLMEITVGETRYEGSPVDWDQRAVWLLGRDGGLLRFDPGEVTSFRKIGPRFRGYSAAGARSRLLRELDGYDVTGTGHYLVCHPPGRGSDYAQLFEQLYRSFVHYFSIRGFSLEDPPYPLVAVLLANRQEFVEYAARKGIRVPDNIVGYYLRTSNRIILYDVAGDVLGSSGRGPYGRSGGGQQRIAPEYEAAIRRQNVGTILHEATHQVAFNTGVHDRLGASPKWVVEGLAMLFESPGIWNGQSSFNAAGRVNHERLRDFRASISGRRTEGMLQRLVASDESFRTSPLIAYAQSWALTFYLVETRPRQYEEYLGRINSRERGVPYTADERLADFRASFGDGLELLEAQWLRHVKGL